jgi:serine kinase of HPr protein (carbohydrate metabolism regulator)
MGTLENIKEIHRPSITVGYLADECRERFQLLPLNDGVGREKLISDKNLHRPQLALTGYTGLFSYHRVQVLGNTEIYYLRSLPKARRVEAFKTLTEFDVPCFVLTTGNRLEPELLEIANERDIAIFSTPHDTTKAVYLLGDFLDDQFAAYASVHGAFVDVYGVGVLFAIRFQKRVEVIVELEDWDPTADYTRTGLEDATVPLLGVETPNVRLPIFPGKNITVIAEVIALNYLLKHYGYNPAKVFAEKLESAIGRKTQDGQTGDRSIPYFEHDFE